MGERFVTVYSQGKLRKIEILEDRVTGARYLFVKDGYGAGLTPLLEKNDTHGHTDNPPVR